MVRTAVTSGQTTSTGVSSDQSVDASTTRSSLSILIVANYLGGREGNPWLLDDLAGALADAGDRVDVLVHDAKNGRMRGLNNYSDERIQVFSVGPRRSQRGRLSKIANYAYTALALHTYGWRFLRKRHYDVCIYTSI